MSKCILLGAGDFNKDYFEKEDYDYLIAVDGGYDYLERKADILIGDFDSIKEMPIKNDKDNKVICYPTQKDESDMLLALQLALSKGFKDIRIYGGTGGTRLAHTIANFYLLNKASKEGVKTFMIGINYNSTVITNAKLEFSSNMKGYISIFSINDESKGINIKNLKYTTKNTTMTNVYPIGISNEFIDTKASIEVLDGSLLVIWDNSCPDLPQITLF